MRAWRTHEWGVPREVLKLDTIPVPVFVAVTMTPGINALLVSETVPPSVAFVDCANTCAGNTDSNTNAMNAVVRNQLLIRPPL